MVLRPSSRLRTLNLFSNNQAAQHPAQTCRLCPIPLAPTGLTAITSDLITEEILRVDSPGCDRGRWDWPGSLLDCAPSFRHLSQYVSTCHTLQSHTTQAIHKPTANMLALLTQTLMSFKRTTLPSIPEEAAEPSDTTSLTAVITGRLQTQTPTASWIISLVNLKSTAPPRNSQGVVVLRGQLALAPGC